MDRTQLDGWVQAYRRAWESNDQVDITALYADGARYFMRPYLDPVVGREAIVADWLDRADAPGETTFDYEIVGVADGIGFVRCLTTYTATDEVYSNLWVVRLNTEGRAIEFTEWWMLHDRPGG